MKSMRILLTGFLPFLDRRVNPSELLVRHLCRQKICGYEILGAILPVTYSGCKKFCDNFSSWNRFDAIIMSGLDSGIDSVNLEQRAINLQKSRHPDDSGYNSNGLPVIEGFPAFLDSPIDALRLSERITSRDRPVKASLYAGTYVCNSLYYRVLAALNGQKIPSIFMHLPTLDPPWHLEAIQAVTINLLKAMRKSAETQLKKHHRLVSMQETRDFLYGFINYERKTGVAYQEKNYNLKRFEDHLNRQANPHRRGRVIHVAGTKGKGCVSALIASILSAHGLRTGLYTSPHLVDIRERIRLDGKAISEPDFIRLAEEQRHLIRNKPLKVQAYRTTFELLTSMAFQYFSRQHTDWDVLETGMGGRLDCTNVVTPEICAITRIDMDHMDSLGSTQLKIASEKAGIIKKDVPVVIGGQLPSVSRFLQDYSKQNGSEAVFANRAVKVRDIGMDLTGTTFSARIDRRWYHDLRINLPGIFQFENCRLALGVIQELVTGNKLALNPDSLRLGLARVQWPGRFTVLLPGQVDPGLDGKRVIIDGAHNPRAIKALMKSVKTLFPDNPVTVVMGCSSNKDADGMVRTIAGHADRFVATTFSNSRALPADALARLARRYQLPCDEADGFKSTVNLLKTCIIPDEIVVITGSLFLAGDWFEQLGLVPFCLDIY